MAVIISSPIKQILQGSNLCILITMQIIQVIIATLFSDISVDDAMIYADMTAYCNSVFRHDSKNLLFEYAMTIEFMQTIFSFL